MFERILRLILGIVAVVLMVGGLVLVSLWFAPMGSLEPEPDPATDYADALTKIAQVQERDTDDFNPVCHTYALTHDEPTDKAFALIHGMSNCPAQWNIFANMLYEAGYNVYVPRMPHNGYADRLDPRATDIFAEELAAYGEGIADILVGLGDETTVMGLSAGGTVTTWISLHRDDIDRSVIIAPSYGPYYIPGRLQRPFVNLIRLIPNQEFWWNSQLKEDIPGPEYAAPLIFSREAAEQFRLGQILLDETRERDPQTDVLFVTNVNDEGVNNELIMRAHDNMHERDETVQLYTFTQDFLVGHDIIDPYQLDANIEAIYPVLYELVVGETFEGEIVPQEDVASSDQ